MSARTFSQKYCLVQLIAPLPDGAEFSMQDWPLHVTMADVFKIDASPEEVLGGLGAALATVSPFVVTVTGEDWFGPDRSVHVRLLDKTRELERLHEICVATLEPFGVVFNAPQYMRDGFKPHSTVRADESLAVGESVWFSQLTLIDMFPDADPAKRRIVGNVAFGG